MNHMYTLWRGHELLGRINPELPGDIDNGMAGVLDNADTGAAIEEVVQSTVEGFPGNPAFQHVGGRTNAGKSQDGHSAWHVESVPMSTGAPDHVPDHLHLSLRDANGSAVTTSLISIMPMPRATRGVQQRCDEAGVKFSGWIVIVGFETQSDAVRRPHRNVGESR